MQILLMEGDRKAAQRVANGLEEEGFVVDVAGSGEEGGDLARINDCDLILLDRLPSGKPGIAVRRRLRCRRLETPTLMLTARDAVVGTVSRGSMPAWTTHEAFAVAEPALAYNMLGGPVAAACFVPCSDSS